MTMSDQLQYMEELQMIVDDQVQYVIQHLYVHLHIEMRQSVVIHKNNIN